VASRIGQCAELIEHGRSGLLCTPGDAAAVAAAFETFARDPALRIALGRNARERARESHSWDAVLAAITSASEERRSELPPLRRLLVSAVSTI
jgi:glycosyltransferase involved in cell wall biosynthesis